MLDGLEDIDWHRLMHAYGPAAELPVLLRGLRSGPAEERAEMIDYLYGSIWHQGDVYPASAPAIPFLLELAADRETPDRDEILHLVTLMAMGISAENLPYGLLIDELRRRPSARYRVAVYDAVAEHLPTVVSLLNDQDERLAATAAFALAWFPDQAQHSGPALLAVASDVDRPHATRVNAVLALGMLGRRGPSAREQLFEELIHLDDRLLRWAAAVASVTTASGQPTPAALAELCTWAAADPTDDLAPWYIDPGDWALRLLDRADPGTADVIRTARVRAALVATPGSSWSSRAAAAVREGFPEGPPPARISYRDLTGAQRQVIRGLAGFGVIFWPPWDAPATVLAQYHLPKTRLGLIWYAHIH